jgi:hypothetical protein
MKTNGPQFEDHSTIEFKGQEARNSLPCHNLAKFGWHMVADWYYATESRRGGIA